MPSFWGHGFPLSAARRCRDTSTALLRMILRITCFAAALMVTDEGRVTATASYPPNYLVESPPRIVLDCSDLILDALPAVIAIVMGVNTPETASVEFLNTTMRKVHYTAFEMDLGISADEAAASVRTGGGEE